MATFAPKGKGKGKGKGKDKGANGYDGGKGSKGGKGGKGGKDFTGMQDTLEPETPMMIVDPAIKEKVQIIFKQTEPTNGRIAYIYNIGTKRDSYLCMLFQKGRCKSHTRCNQIHADKDVVNSLREAFCAENGQPREVVDEPLSHQRAVEVVVVDPTNQESRVAMPCLRTLESTGRKDFFDRLESTGQVPEARLCTHYLTASADVPEAEVRGLCPDAELCKFIHAEPSFLRFIIEPNKPCCTFHGVDHVVDFQGRVSMVNKKNQRCPLPLNRIMTTKGLRGLITTPTSLVFACNRVCRLHQEKRCQWGRECSNLHICREFYSTYASCSSPAATSMPSAPNHHITANGKLKLKKGRRDTANGCVLGQPLMGPQERYGIPLVTDEGPVQKDLLPEIAKKRYPDAPAILGTPMGMIASGAAVAPAGANGNGSVNGGVGVGVAVAVNGNGNGNPPEPKPVPEGLQQVQEVDSEQGTPPTSPLYPDARSPQGRPVEGQTQAGPSDSGLHEHVLPITTSTTSTLYPHPSFLSALPQTNGNAPTPLPANIPMTQGLGAPLGGANTPYLPQTWSEYDAKPHSMQPQPQPQPQQMQAPPPQMQPQPHPHHHHHHHHQHQHQHQHHMHHHHHQPHQQHQPPLQQPQPQQQQQQQQQPQQPPVHHHHMHHQPQYFSTQNINDIMAYGGEQHRTWTAPMNPAVRP